MDHFIIDQNIRECTKDCKVTKCGIGNDHSGLLLKLGIKCDEKTRKTCKKSVKWGKWINHKVMADFNIALDNIILPLSNIEDFLTAIMSSGKKSYPNKMILILDGLN